MYNKNIYIFLNNNFFLYTDIINIFYFWIMQIFYWLLLIASLLFSQSVFASEPVEEEITKYKITSISYSNDLVDGVEVKISGENLDKCDSISHAWKKTRYWKTKFYLFW